MKSRGLRMLNALVSPERKQVATIACNQVSCSCGDGRRENGIVFGIIRHRFECWKLAYHLSQYHKRGSEAGYFRR